MPFIFRGVLCGELCESYREPLAGAVLRLYQPESSGEISHQVSAATEETLGVLAEAAISAKKGRLLAEVRLDENGAYQLELTEEEHQYEGGPLEIDLRFGSVPNQQSEKSTPVQVALTTLQPKWQMGNDQVFVAAWEFCLPIRFWCAIRALFDAWVIIGKISFCDQPRQGIAGLQVTAFDADWISDDRLGTTLTDETGHFRIDYQSKDFTRTFLSPFINVETPFSYQKGPDVYFVVESLGSPTVTLLQETRSDGQSAARRNRSHCFCVDLCVEGGVDLRCELTQPLGCLSTDANNTPLPGLLPIEGTASGLGFLRYELSLWHGGSLDVSAALVYADAGGNPDPSLSNGPNQVIANPLGFIDLAKLIQLTGNNISTDPTFELRLSVVGIDNSRSDCRKTFSLLLASVNIKTVGGAIVADVLPPNEPLRSSDDPSAALRSVGGNISVRGAAEVFGCSDERSRIVQVWVQEDSSFSLPQPPNGLSTAYDPLANGWSMISEVVYDDDPGFAMSSTDNLYSAAQKWDENPLSGPTSWLTYLSNWGVRNKWLYLPAPFPPIKIVVPDLKERRWPSETRSGRYSLLLKVEDTLGKAYYDLQRVWLDNKSIRGKISELQYQGGATIPPCEDLSLGAGLGVAQQLDIRGFATDPLIDPTDLSQPSDNFDSYQLFIRKQGVGTEVEIAASSLPVPTRSVWADGAGDPPVDVLATLPLSHLDMSSSTAPSAAWTAHQLARGESCTYVIRLQARDQTIVSESTVHHLGVGYLFPVKITNDLPL